MITATFNHRFHLNSVLSHNGFKLGEAQLYIHICTYKNMSRDQHAIQQKVKHS